MKSKDQQLLEEAYTKAYTKTSPAKFDYQTFVFYDRSMQPGGGLVWLTGLILQKI
jgi:hypothetical protein